MQAIVYISYSKALLYRMLRLLNVFILIGFTLNSCSAFSTEFNRLFYSGKWANAKLWLLDHRSNLPALDYFTKHLQLGYFLNEHELCRAYCDSLRNEKAFNGSLRAKITYHILSSKYYQYHLQPTLALYHARQALNFATITNDEFAYCMSYTQLANAMRKVKDEAGIKQRSMFAEKAYQLAMQMDDSFYLYKAKVIQVIALIDIDQISGSQISGLVKTKIIRKLDESNAIILKHHTNHPQLVHNYLLQGFTYLAEQPDLGIRLFQKAQQILSNINDGNHGLLIYLSASLNHLMDKAYEIKYRQTRNEDYLNKAIVWAKQNINLDEHKQRYEGFYLYRRYIDHYNVPAEQRIAKLYLTLYNLTGNDNYLNFATKYIEYFRHRPITQIGKLHNLFDALKEMALIENHEKITYKVKTDYTNNIITNPAHVARFLEPNQAIIGYFTYETHHEDSVVFLVQCIEKSITHNLILCYAKKEISSLSENLYKTVEWNRPSEYKQQAHLAFKLLLEPALQKLGKQVKQLHIIQPAFFSTPLQFDGFLINRAGTGFTDFNYVFDAYNISYITSFTHFVSNKQKDIAVKQVNIWNPDYSSTPLAELTETRKINETIANLFPAKPVSGRSKKELLSQLLTGEILQVSAHARASFDQLERPRIYTALLPDSVLFDIDLEPLSTRTRLVIYAACKSNVGNMQHNGIIDGFTRATLSAGAGGTVCTLYNVEESVTCEILESFYKKLAAGYSSSEALYLAKKELKQKYPNPRLWQAYIYTGSDQTFKSTAKPSGIILFITLVLIFPLVTYGLLKSNFN